MSRWRGMGIEVMARWTHQPSVIAHRQRFRVACNGVIRPDDHEHRQVDRGGSPLEPRVVCLQLGNERGSVEPLGEYLNSPSKLASSSGLSASSPAMKLFAPFFARAPGRRWRCPTR